MVLKKQEKKEESKKWNNKSHERFKNTWGLCFD